MAMSSEKASVNVGLVTPTLVASSAGELDTNVGTMVSDARVEKFKSVLLVIPENN